MEDATEEEGHILWASKVVGGGTFTSPDAGVAAGACPERPAAATAAWQAALWCFQCIFWQASPQYHARRQPPQRDLASAVPQW